MPIPYDQSYPSEIEETKPNVVLMDIVSPSIADTDTCQKFKEFIITSFRAKIRIVLALSSSFFLYTSLEAQKATMWVNFMTVGKAITFKSWDDVLSRDFLLSLNYADSRIDGLLRTCSGIPKLLSLCHQGNSTEQLDYVKQSEFNVVLSYISKHKSAILWKDEIDILMAAKFGLNIEDVGLTPERAENLVVSYLVSIKDSVPTLCFPSSDDSHLTILLSSMWENMGLSSMVKPDSESVVGQYFECQVPRIICNTDTLSC